MTRRRRISHRETVHAVEETIHVECLLAQLGGMLLSRNMPRMHVLLQAQTPDVPDSAPTERTRLLGPRFCRYVDAAMDKS